MAAAAVATAPEASVSAAGREAEAAAAGPVSTPVRLAWRECVGECWLNMEALFNFLLQEGTSGESFDPRAARPRCKICGADAWLQWDGHYADYCSRSCRDKQNGTQSRLPAPGPTYPSQRRRGRARGPPEMLGERQAQVQQAKEDQWEMQFSPRNRHLPRKKAQNQEQEPQQQQQRGQDSRDATAVAGAFVEAAAAKKIARALRQRASRKAPLKEFIGLPMEQGLPSAATTPGNVPIIASKGSEENLPLRRQRTVARFREEGENAEELQTALREYQKNLGCQRQKLAEERISACDATAAADAEHLRRFGTATAAATTAVKPATKQQRKENETTVELPHWERAQWEEQMKAIKAQSEQQLQQHKAELAAEVKRLAAEELNAQKVLKEELGAVRISLAQLKQQQEQQRQQQQQLFQKELEQHLRAELQHDLEKQLERKLREQLQEEVGQRLRQQMQRKQEQLRDPGSVEKAEGERSKEDMLRQELLEQQVQQEERLQQQLLQQQRHQEKLSYQLQQHDQTLQLLAAAAGKRSSTGGPQRPSCRVQQIPADQQLRDLLLEGLFSHLRTYGTLQQQHERHRQQTQQQRQQQRQQPETLVASSWAERELALRDAKAAAAAAASEAKGSLVFGPYEGQLEAAVLEASLQLLEPTQQHQHETLRFGSKLQVVFRVATGPSAWEERETSFSADGRWGETFSFSVHWPSAAAASASAALYAQLWATTSCSIANTSRCSSSCRCFVGEAAIPLPTFTSPWEYRAPLRWRTSLGGSSQHQQRLLQGGNLRLRVQFHPTDKTQTCVPSVGTQKDFPVLPTTGVIAEQFNKPNHCGGSNKGSSTSHSSRSTDSRSSGKSSFTGDHGEEQLQPANLPADVSEGDGTLQRQLLQQLDELSLVWWRALREQQQKKHHQERMPVVIDGQMLQDHLQQPRLMGALCTNSFCSNMAGEFADLYSEEEFRVWGLCGSCQRQLFTTPLPAARTGRHLVCSRLQLTSPFAHCCRETYHDFGVIKALARAAVCQEPLPFGELRLDGNIPVAFPTPECLWPSALQLLHAQRFSLVCVQERLRRCSCSGELLALLQSPLLQRFERPDWHSRAAAAVRTCLLLLLQQHPKLQLLLSSLGGRHICYHDPLQLRLLRRTLQQQELLQQQEQSEGKSACTPHETHMEGTAEATSLPHNLAGLLLMDLCKALSPPIYE